MHQKVNLKQMSSSSKNQGSVDSEHFGGINQKQSTDMLESHEIWPDLVTLQHFGENQSKMVHEYVHVQELSNVAQFYSINYTIWTHARNKSET